MKKETKTFAQFSERLADLNLKSTTNRNKQIENESDEPSALESLLEQLKKQTHAVKETLSQRSPIETNDTSNKMAKYINGFCLLENNTNAMTELNSNRDIANDKANFNKNKKTKSKIPLIQSIKIDDDLNSDFNQGKDQYQNNNYLSSIPVSSSILVAESSIKYNPTFGKQSDVINELSPQSSQINDQFNEAKKKSEVKREMNDNLKISKDSLKRSRDGSGQKGYEKKNSIENNLMVVDVVESEGSDGEDKEELDYYSKSIKRTNNTNNIHDIPEEKGESDEEEDKGKEIERQRIERENEIKRKQREDEEKKIKDEEQRKKEAIEKQKRKEALGKQKQKEKRGQLEKQRQDEESAKQKEKEKEKEELEKQNRNKSVEKREREESLQKQKDKEKEREIKRQKQEQQKEKEPLEEQNEKKKKESKTNNKKKQTLKEDKFQSNKDNTTSNKDNDQNIKIKNPPAEYINIEIEDIDDIPELDFEEKKKTSRVNNNSDIEELASSQNKTKLKEEPKKLYVSNDNDSDIKKKSIVNKSNPNPLKTKAKKKHLNKSQDDKKNNEEDNNIQFNPQRIRERIIKEMTDFDVNDQDLEKYDFTLMRSFEGKDPHLINTIPNYEKVIIESEGNKVFLRRRKAFLDNAYFKTRIEEDDSKNDFLIFVQKLPNPYPKVICDNYAKVKRKDQLFPKSYNYKNEKLFNHNPKIGSSRTIGDIGNISTFVYQFSLNLCPNLIDSAIEAFSHWRHVKCDGNSFYRVVMFSIIEQFIINQYIEGIEMICNEIHRLSDTFKERKIDIEPVFIVFKLIINALNDNDINSAYDTFIKGYNNMKNNMVDKALIYYLREIVSQYIKDTYTLIEEEVKKTNAKLDKSYFMNYISVLENNIEPELDIINLIKYIFNTDIEIFWMDGPFDNPSFAHMKLNNRNKKDDEHHLSLNKIYLGYFFSSYYITYPNKQHIQSELLKEKMSEGIASFTQLVYIDKKNKKTCGLCGRSSAKIYFLQKQFYSCVECLRDYLDTVLIDRAKTFALANFVSFEYYTRDIQLSKDYYISNFDFIELIESETLAERLFNIIQTICFDCGGYLNEDKSNNNRNELKCKCCYCIKCLWEKQLKATNGLKVINKFEKFKFVKVQCNCDHPFDPVDAQRFCKEITEDDVKNAQDRMNRYISSMCCICVNIKLDPETLGSFHSIPVLQENSPNKGIDYSNIPHMICQNCFKAEKAKISISLTSKSSSSSQPKRDNEEQKENKAQIGKEDIVMLKCNICKKKHSTEKKSWNAKESPNTCCNTECVII